MFTTEYLEDMKIKDLIKELKTHQEYVMQVANIIHSKVVY